MSDNKRNQIKKIKKFKFFKQIVFSVSVLLQRLAAKRVVSSFWVFWFKVKRQVLQSSEVTCVLGACRIEKFRGCSTKDLAACFSLIFRPSESYDATCKFQNSALDFSR